MLGLLIVLALVVYCVQEGAALTHEGDGYMDWLERKYGGWEDGQ